MPLDFLKKNVWIFIAVFSLLFSLWGFMTIPGFWFDEGIIAQTAKNIAEYGVYGIQTASGEFFSNNFWITTGYPVIFPIAFVFKLLGASISTARIVPLTYLVFFVVVSYFFIRKLYSDKAAFFSTLLLVTFSPLYGNGKAVLGETPGLFFLVFGGLLFLIYEERNEKKFLFFSALSWGLAVATKPYYLLFSASVLFIGFVLWLKKKETATQVLSFLFLFSIPVLYWGFLSFDISSIAHFKATFSYFLNSYGVSSFEPFKNLFRFVTESTPVHFTLLALAVFGARFVSAKEKRAMPLAVDAVLIFIALSFLWYLKTPGWYRYFYSIHVLTLLLFPAALLFLVERVVCMLNQPNVLCWWIATITPLILFQTGFLFLEHDQFFGDDVLRVNKYMTAHISPNASVYIASKPEISFGLPQKNFSQSIFINQNLIIGNERIIPGAYDYIIVGASNEDRFFFINKNVNDRYVLEQEIGHYRLYRQNGISPRSSEE